MTPAEVESLFRHPEGYRFARWGRPVVPVVFGVSDETLRIVKGAVEAVVATAGHKMAEHDPELGANLMMFFFRDWSELTEVPNLERLIPDIVTFANGQAKLGAGVARIFRFDEDGAIRLSILFLRVDEAVAESSAHLVMLDQAARSILTWQPEAILVEDGVLRPDVAAVLKAAYDPVLPNATSDKSHALRLAARL